jgi:hypothetical protein
VALAQPSSSAVRWFLKVHHVEMDGLHLISWEVWGVQPVEMADVTGRTAVGGEIPPPWHECSGVAHDPEGRSWLWEVWTSERWAMFVSFDDGPALPLTRLPDPAGWVRVDADSEGVIVVDRPAITAAVLEELEAIASVHGRRMLLPIPTEAEDEALDQLDRAGVQAAIDRAVAALIKEFGVSGRIHRADVARASAVLHRVGWRLDFRVLLEVLPISVSKAARRDLRTTFDPFRTRTAPT